MAQIEDNTNAVASQNTYSPVQIVSIPYNLVNATRFYSLDCKEWIHKAPGTKTWDTLNALFVKVFKDALDDDPTA